MEKFLLYLFQDFLDYYEAKLKAINGINWCLLIKTVTKLLIWGKEFEDIIRQLLI